MKATLLVLMTAFSVVAHPVASADAGANEAPATRHLEVQRAALAAARRVQAWQRRADDRRAAQYAENRRRCQAALRLAELCGKNAGTFYCDDRGFKSIPASERSPSAPLDRSGKYAMQRCVAEATKNGS